MKLLIVRKRQHEVSHNKVKNKSATREIQLVPFEIPTLLSIQFRAKSYK